MHLWYFWYDEVISMSKKTTMTDKQIWDSALALQEKLNFTKKDLLRNQSCFYEKQRALFLNTIMGLSITKTS